jgi:hypothetical protein
MNRRKRKAHWLMSTGRALPLVLALGALPVLVACGDGAGREEAGQGEPGRETTGVETEPVVLGPVDGLGLPGTDLNRVAVGSQAPDFSLRTLEGDTVTLSAFRGSKDVVLVFYRGHW